MPDKQLLTYYQALPLSIKILMSRERIREWYNHWAGRVCVSFSGGKDSTVLADLVHRWYPEVPLFYINTGLEYPEVQAFARRKGAVFIRPRLRFDEVISQYGYPLISKENSEAIQYCRRIIHAGKEVNYEKSVLSSREAMLNNTSKKFNRQKWLPLTRDTHFRISHYCCYMLKKSPVSTYQKLERLQPILGTLAEESKLREQVWLKHGCNIFEGRKIKSQPMSFWTEQDVLGYIRDQGLEIASVYGDIIQDESGTLKCSGCQRTGCIFCGFGAHLEKGETRFQRLARTHPRQYEYCMGGGQWVDNPDYDPALPKMDGNWENWNPKKIWVPSKEGLGMKKVFDDTNQIYGKDFIRYE